MMSGMTVQTAVAGCNCRLDRIGAVCLLALALAAPARAQVFTGRIDVTVEDPTGARLPGVVVELSGPEVQTQVADAAGQAHFLSLPVGVYTVKVSLTGFAPETNSHVEVVSGASTALDVKLKVAGGSETVNVVAVTRAVDVRRATTTVNISLTEMQELPTARDPWALLETVPTVFLDRVNVGGSESGQQANYNAKGAQNTDNAWTIDCVPVTDMGDNVVRPRHASGASAFYYDFDALQEMAITTGGADAQNATGGVQVNVVLRKGTNLPHGSMRYFFENQSLQSVNMPADRAAALGGSPGTGNRAESYRDYGFDLGGPLLRDKIFIWGTMGRTGINLLTLNGLATDTAFDNVAFKAEGRMNNAVRGNFAFYENAKDQTGRDAGPTRPIETTWSQSGPTRYFKGEGNFIVRKGLFASVKGAYVSAGFDLIPAGGLAKDYYIDSGGVVHNTYYQYQTTRPQLYFGGDASYFSGINEVKFGASWRRTSADTRQTWPGSHLVATWDNYPNMLVQVARDYHSVTRANYMSTYVTDTLSLERVTLTGGIRFDRRNPTRTASINGVAPGMKPPVTHELLAGIDKEFAPDFAVSGTFTYRRMQDLLWTPLIGVTRANYTQTATLTGTAAEVGAFSVPLYALSPAAVPPGGGKLSANRPGYHQRFLGFEVSVIKRLSSRWMARAGF